MQLRIDIEDVRPISRLTLDLDLTKHRILCIVGKNGAGKTTLAKSIMNLAYADTFARTSSAGIFGEKSVIRYSVANDTYTFNYDQNLRLLSTRTPVRSSHKQLVSVEMPPPHGDRFTFFRTLADHDNEIRKAIVLNRYEKPVELINFLSNIYRDDRFSELVEVRFSRGSCCCFVLPDKRYIREDYFSSGEYFLINLYRKVAQGTALIVIDEIDISLDASTQSRLAERLRELCKKYGSSVVFTSHSLALMQTLEPEELCYLDRDDVRSGSNALELRSFNWIKSELFQFEGYDRYILTEDKVLEGFLHYFINRYCSPTFFSYQIIYVSGNGYVKSLMQKNAKHRFFGPPENVIGVLDGDQAGTVQDKRLLCIPLPDVEKAFWGLYKEEGFAYRLNGGEDLDPKQLYRKFTGKKRILSPQEIFRLLCDRHDDAMKSFSKQISGFLCRVSS